MANLLASFVKKPITPPYSLRMAGYPLSDSSRSPFSKYRLAESAADHLYARCLVLSDSARTLVLLSLDVLACAMEDADAIRAIVRANVGAEEWEKLTIWVTATHTHSGPDTYGLFGGVPRRYKDFLADHAAITVLHALQSLQPARLAHASIPLDGRVGNFRDPEQGYVDTEMGAIYIETEAGAPLATVVNLGCEPNILGPDNRLYSADFPGALCDYLLANGGGEGLFVNGAAGDLCRYEIARDFNNARGGDRTYAKMCEFGQLLGRKVLAAKPPAAAFTAEVPVRPVKAGVRIPLENPQLRRSGVLKRDLSEGKLLTEVWRMDIGSATILTSPAMIFAALGKELRDVLKDRRLFLFGLTNDAISYVAPKERFAPDGIQERTSLGPNTWSHLKAALLALPPSNQAADGRIS